MRLFWLEVGFIIYVSGVMFAQIRCQNNSCHQNTDIGNPTRSRAHFLPDTDVSMCDYYTIEEENWYSFKVYGAYVRIPELAIDEHFITKQCGTTVPIWIEGVDSHPTGNTTVTAKVCVTYGASSCDWSATVTIQRCLEGVTEYFVYQLARPGGCSMAYCAGDKPACPSGQTYDTTNKTCINDHPPMSTLPKFSGPHLRTDPELDHFSFSCEPFYAPQATNLTPNFNVTFLFDGVVDLYENKTDNILAVPVFVVKAFNGRAVLDDKYLRGRLGKWISCTVQSYWEHTPDKLSPVIPSAERYWAGIKVQGSLPVHLDSSMPTQKLTLLPTVPVICHKILHIGPCGYRIEISSPIPKNNCAYVILPSHYNGSLPSIGNSENNIIRVTVPNRLSPKQISNEITFPPIVPSLRRNSSDMQYSPIWDYYKLQPIPILINQRKGSFCHVYFDPHIITFDASPSVDSYLCNYTGDFNLWKSADSRLAEVQISFWGNSIPYKKWVGACAVAFREGNHILGLTMCNSPNIGGKYAVTSIDYLSEIGGRRGITMRSGDTYTMLMPSGTTVIIYVYDKYMNVHVLPLDIDRKLSTGLCGNYNDDLQDDKTDCTLFRIPPEESYFAGPAKCKNYTVPVALPCECKNVGRDDQTLVCSEPTSARTQYVCHGSGRRRRSAEESYDDTVIEDSDIFYSMPWKDPPPLNDWPTPSGISEAAAKAECDRVLRLSPVYDQCNATMNMRRLAESCVMDVRVGDTFEVAVDYSFVMETECKIELEASLLVTSTEPHIVEQVMAPLAELSNKICPNHCSGKGTCEDGKCKCEKGYTKVDCSLEENMVPSNVTLRNKGLCDRRSKPCKIASLFASSIDTSKTILCRLRVNGLNGEEEVATSPATVVSETELLCNLTSSPIGRDQVEGAGRPFITYGISITNNGNHYSSEILLSVYDPFCVECLAAGNCKLKAKTCLDQDMWSTWSSCSRDCDYGVKSRGRYCQGGEQCEEGLQVQKKLCIVQDCEDNQDQHSEGVQILISGVDLKTAIANEHRLYEAVTNNINEYCSRHLQECCQENGFTFIESSSTIKLVVASRNRTSLAAGYPKIEKENAILKIVTMISRSDMEHLCSNRMTHQPGNSKADMYLDSRVLLTATSKGVSNIEEAMGVRVMSINGVGSEEILDSSKWMYVGIGISAFVVTAAIIVTVVCCVVKRKLAKI